MKLLFLDFDGVLNGHPKRTDPLPEWAKDDWPFTWVEGKRIRVLEPLLAYEDFRIVVSSTWRLNWNVPGLARILNEYLPGLGDRIIGITPRERAPVEGHKWGSPILIAQGRGREIKQWMKENKFDGIYAIVDDDSDMLPEQMPYFVKTESLIGLTPKHVNRIKSILQYT